MTGVRRWLKKRAAAGRSGADLADAAAPVDVAARNPGELLFRCNVCSTKNAVPARALGRETASCSRCRSTVRMRGIVAALSRGLYGESRTLDEFAPDLRVRGIGMSDWVEYAGRLARIFDYRNTYYHQEPRLDITAIPPEMEGTLDFIISTDVFEHVCPPVSRAFENSARLLKPGGILVFSVPYTKVGATVEHFPELHEFEVVVEQERHVLRNKTRDGRLQVFDNLVFHGGPGETLEMRVFSEAGLMAELRSAGFREIEIQVAPVFEHGIWWAQDWSLPILARR